MTGAATEPRAASVRGRRAWRQFWRSPLAVLGALVLLAFVLMALFAPYLAPFNPAEAQLLHRLEPPLTESAAGTRFLLGTDHLGRDLLSRLVYGSRVALIVGLGGVALSATLGVSVGLVSGYFGGWWDTLSMRLVDTLIAIPNVLLYLTVLGVFGPSLTLLILVIGLINWTTFARVVRGEVLAIKEREFVEASRASGQRALKTLLKHVLTNILAPIIVIATLDVAAVIILEAALSYLGLGVQPPTVTWGRMLADGRDYLATAWWVATFPGLFITLLCLSLIFLGDWLRDVLDPRTH
ncbi:ABC transporter permease [Truepera radiovictrix]|uniref:Binding-protein-dependent transport systems inner membrane component n=1 Tax=Truepera radiovictrix (strain DSM 17093 / CIP 108686 / LMG 22925 / RQ-24) TaxID=649638 RepID=D7CUT2_TRURR|nr:ABC transporter permease [Truepera radiovictrix]ADI14073.1 binding-protein-dependent transport systems inner membrane component [Truepera radiovictrix DSM 17093]WMT57365.1 ABC transporter permease [Truepera radiovictrix]